MITPVEIQSKAFKSGIGYDKKDVDGFINEILENYEELYRSNVELKDKINMLNDGLQHYKNIESSLQKALVLAEKTSEETIRTAELKAQTIEMDAINKAKAHTADAKRELEQVHNQTVALVQQYTKYKAQFTQFLNAQLDLISSDSFRMDVNDFAAFAKTAASPNDAYLQSNPMSDFLTNNESTSLPGFNNDGTTGGLGQRDDADRYGTDFNNVSTFNTSAGQADSLNAQSTATPVAEKEAPVAEKEATPIAETEVAASENLDTFEGEVEDKVDKRAMLGDEDANSTGFTFI